MTKESLKESIFYIGSMAGVEVTEKLPTDNEILKYGLQLIITLAYLIHAIISKRSKK